MTARGRSGGGGATIGSALGAWGPPAGWAALLFVLSSIPGRSLPETSVPFSDKLVHCLVYAVMGALCFRAVRRTSVALGGGRVLAVAVLITTSYGASDELHQSVVPQRSPDVRDLAADAAGGAAGAALALWLSAKRRAGSGARPAAAP